MCFAYMYTTYLTAVQGSHKGVSNPLKLELQTVVNCHVGALVLGLLSSEPSLQPLKYSFESYV